MIGRTPATIRATRPLRHGVIADFEVTEQMLRHFIRRAIGGRFAHPRVVLCVPSGITEVERRAVEEATLVAGAARGLLDRGADGGSDRRGPPGRRAAASMVVDIGGGTSEVAVISLGGMVVWNSVRVGGYEMDDAIVDHARKEHGLLIGQERAEEVKIEIGAACESAEAGHAQVAGRDQPTGLLKRRRSYSQTRYTVRSTARLSASSMQ